MAKLNKPGKVGKKIAKEADSVMKKPKTTTKATSDKGTVVVTKTKYDSEGKITGKPVTKSVDLEISTFVTDTAKVSIGNSIKKSDGNYGSAEISVHVTLPGYVEELDSIAESAAAIADSLLQKEIKKAGFYEDADEADEAPKAKKSKKAKEVDDSDDEDSEDEDTISEAKIRTMKTAGLKKLIKEYELDVDPDDYEDVKELREAVLASLSEDEDSEDDEDEDSDDEADDSEEEDDEDEDSDDEDEGEDDDEDDDEDSDDEEEEEDEDDEDESDEEESEWYSKEELMDADLDELEDVAKEYKIKVKVSKTASPKEKKKAFVAAILKHGENA